MPSKQITCLDLFSGCGGMSLGLSLAKYKNLRIKSVAAIDNWKVACETYEVNLEVAPINDGVSIGTVQTALNKVGNVDLVVGGPPCQGFSTSGKRALSDKRNHLVKAFLDAVELASPKAFIMENVTGFTTFQDGHLLTEVIDRANDLGFHVHPGVLLASRFGVPQRRRRFILVGERTGKFEFPKSTDADRQPGSQLEVDQRSDSGFKTISFNEATSDLPKLLAGEQKHIYTSDPKNSYQKWVRGSSKILADHIAPRHSKEFVELMSYIPQGSSAFTPEVYETIPKGLRPGSGFTNSYARILGSQPSPTITRNFTTPSSANCIHPRYNRALSLREGARCQSFPDTFTFEGSMSDKRLQIGNAVPPLLAKAVAESLLKFCFE
jgi:DNA (cytosine-5)-methyltransferase 1